MTATLQEILKRKADYPVRLLSVKDAEDMYDDKFIWRAGDEFGIEAIDFSIGNIRLVNKTSGAVVYEFYNKETGELENEFKIKL